MLCYELINRHPDDRVGFVFNGKETTFGEMRRQVNAWAAFLQAEGIEKGDRVGIHSRNCTDYIAAYLAIIKAGAIVVPVNFQLIAPEIAYIVNDASMKLLITHDHIDNLEEALSYYGYRNKVRQLEFKDLRKDITKFNSVLMTENDPCSIIYTSGTTGRPKGAVLSHKNIISDTLDVLEFVDYKEDDVSICVLPMYHCLGWTCGVNANLYKGTLNVIQDVFNFSECLKLIAKYKVTTFIAVPPIILLFLKAAPADSLASIRILFSGGAALSKAVYSKFREKFGKTIQEGYGLSEASPVVMGNPGDNPDKANAIGIPMPRQTVKIMDEDMRELPPGEVGEICVKGPNVMQCYWKREKETQHALRNGWLHTEDLGYKDRDGYFYIVDRLRDLIIVAGENVYPREVEEVLLAHPDVADAAVIGIPDSLRGQIVCAYIVKEEGAVLNKNILRKYLMGKVAPYKIPKEYIFTELLPRNSSGKVLKTVLRERAMER